MHDRLEVRLAAALDLPATAVELDPDEVQTVFRSLAAIHAHRLGPLPAPPASPSGDGPARAPGS